MRAILFVLAAILIALPAASPSIADARRVTNPQKLIPTSDAVIERNYATEGTKAPAAPMARGRTTLILDASDVALGFEVADSIDPFVAAIGLTGQSGALVVSVVRGGPAAKAGLLPGDLIVTANGQPVSDGEQLKVVLRDSRASAVPVEIIRIGNGPSDLIAQLRATAAAGNRDATLALGDAALFNIDTRGQTGLAKDYYLKAFGMGDARAAYRLGTMYAEGRGVSPDLATATHWYKIASDAGLPAGQFALALTWWNARYWTGLALEGNAAEAVRLLKLAAARDYAPAYIYLGLASHFGTGTERDYAAAAAWYDKAAAAGDVDAMFRRAEMVEAGQGVAADPAASLALFDEAARLGSLDANLRLGEKYWRGDGVMQHPLRALNYLRIAAAQGDSSAMSLIAHILLSGYGVTRDEAGAVRWYFRAYQAGDADAGYALALAYADGIGVPQDLGKVAGFMLDAIRRGSAAALAEMKGNAEGWDIAVREDLQELLQAGGFYTGAIDGVFGPGTLRALDASAGPR